MSFRDDFIVAVGSKVDLSKIKTNADGGFDKEDAIAQTQRNLERIGALQEKLYVEHKRAVLIVFQAMDAGGKDGAVKSITREVNPQGVKVVSFKQPSKEELDHDYLWRVHQKTPAKGEITIFNRSHYEDVLVVRVHGFVPEEQWKKRYGQINDFERLLSENGTDILKFYLHIGRDEQLQRLRERVETPEKNWKFNEGDMQEREKWDDYMAAFEDALSKCSTKEAPWFVVPADRKWFRDLVISQIVVDHLEAMNLQLPKPTFNREEILAKYFAGDAGKKPAKDDKKRKPAV